MMGTRQQLVLLWFTALALACTACGTCHAAPVASILQQPQGEILSSQNMVGQVEAMEEELILVLDPPEPQILHESLHVEQMAVLELNVMRRLFPYNKRGYPVCAAANARTAATINTITTATDSTTTEEKVRQALADLASLPAFPEFAPCVARPSSLELAQTHPDAFQEASLVPATRESEASIAVCGTILGRDPSDYIFLGEPDNCPKLPGHVVMRSWGGAGPAPPWEGFDPSCSMINDYVPEPPTGFDVVRLRRVYVNGQGLVFNRSTLFNFQGCPNNLLVQYPAYSRNVTHVHRAFSLVYWQTRNFYHTLIESVAAVMQMSHFVSRDPELPVLGFKSTFESLEAILRPILGASPMKLRRYELKRHVADKGDLFHVDTLFQPVLPVCGFPDPQLWRYLRRHHILPRDGLPIFKNDWTLRRPNAKPLSHAQMAAYPSDWVVVAARREGTKRVLSQMPQIIALLQQLFGKEHVVTFWGKRSILEARDLFRRARLYVAGHGAAMSNIVFMPANSTVLEIRPRGRKVACFHALAEACGIRYNLLLGENADTEEEMTTYNVDMSKVEETIRRIVANLS